MRGYVSFKYDHDDDGVFVYEGDKNVLYFTAEQIVLFLKCLSVDRVKENFQNNKDVAKFMNEIVHTRICEHCSGTGVELK